MNQEGFQNFNTVNFSPLTLANNTQSVILVALILDVSPSISSYAQQMNAAAREVFLQELRTCHRKDDILVKCITFCEDVEHKSGFAPVTTVPDSYFDVNPTGRATALYRAVKEGLEHTINYRKDLEAQGIDVRSCVYIITDGEDNSSPSDAKEIAKIVEDMRHKEEWTSTFTINMLGVGDDANFRGACTKMGLNPDKCLDQISDSAHEIRKHMGVVSQSISSSANAPAVSF